MLWFSYYMSSVRPQRYSGRNQMSTLTPQPSFLATRLGKLTLALLCAVAFLDFVDASIINIALPAIRHDLHVSRSEEHTSELQSPVHLVCRLLLEKKKSKLRHTT